MRLRTYSDSRKHVALRPNLPEDPAELRRFAAALAAEVHAKTFVFEKPPDLVNNRSRGVNT
jgi:hypothetical protein